MSPEREVWCAATAATSRPAISRLLRRQGVLLQPGFDTSHLFRIGRWWHVLLGIQILAGSAADHLPEVVVQMRLIEVARVLRERRACDGFARHELGKHVIHAIALDDPAWAGAYVAVE